MSFPFADMINRLSGMLGLGARQPDVSEDVSIPRAPFDPTPKDVFVTKAMLAKGLGLAPEIVDAVLDYAEYWPHTSVQSPYSWSAVGGGARGSHQGLRENRLILRTIPVGFLDKPHDHWEPNPQDFPPLEPLAREYTPDEFNNEIDLQTPLLARPCRKIVFTIKSRDQGWGGSPNDRGTYRGSYSWFEAGLERFDAGVGSEEQRIQGKVEYRKRQQQSKPASSINIDLNTYSDSDTDTTDISDPSISIPLETLPRFHPCHLRTINPELAFHEDSTTPSSLRFELLANDNLKVQANRTATSEPEEHVVTWRYDDPEPTRESEAQARMDGRGLATHNFVRELKLGDVVTLWAKARFPGWQNMVEECRVDVYWAV